MKAAIVGIAGLDLADAERALFAGHPPAGVILFARNIDTPGQICRLTAALRTVLPEHAVLMIDQEGGRVARLRPPHWRAHPAAGAIGSVYRRDAAAGVRCAWLTGALIGAECRAVALDVVNAPVLDLQLPDAHAVIGDRAYDRDPAAVAVLGGAMADGLRAAGIQPVAKHIPGHGRATADSHHELPYLSHGSAEDLAVFAANAGIGWAMTAHIVYADWDALRPATLSAAVIGQVIRGRCGFGGVLVSDDLSMKALSGTPDALALEALAAGCDLVLHCTGQLAESRVLLEACAVISDDTQARMGAARAAAVARPLDAAALAAERDALMAVHA